MQTLRSYNNIGEAGFAQSLLEAAGIPASLEHEAATSLSPVGVSAVRLQVPPERFVEAERILAEHPVHFSGPTEDVPHFGFWRGSVAGLLTYLCAVGLLRMMMGASHFNIAIMLLVCFVGGVIGANYRTGKRP